MSKPRDFILATMPQFEMFYELPSNAKKKMLFGKLFVNLFQQGQRAGTHILPVITDELISVAEFQRGVHPATANTPEPSCLGNLVELILGPKPLNGPKSSPRRVVYLQSRGGTRSRYDGLQ
jgi:hypothetical protein